MIYLESPLLTSLFEEFSVKLFVIEDVKLHWVSKHFHTVPARQDVTCVSLRLCGIGFVNIINITYK